MTRCIQSLLLLVTLAHYTHAQDADSCSLYLAETMDARGRLSMGVFTAKDLASGSLVGFPDVVIPLVDVPIHNSPTHEDEEQFWWAWKDFVWDALDVGGLQEGIDVKAAALGLGSLTRGNKEEANVMLIQSHFDNSGLHRSRDPGAGAVSYYHGAAMVSTEPIPAGRELYFPNGYHWYLDSNEQDSVLDSAMALSNPRVQEFFKRYQDLEGKHGAKLSSEVRSKIWGILENSPLDDKVRSLLPHSWTDASSVADHVSNKGVRSPEWLQKNGLCIDNIRQGPSTLPQAGRGAFATRTLPDGSVIAPAPLVHIMDKKSLYMFEPQVDEDFTLLLSDTIAGEQLMVNYCFGHEQSSKLLCPIGAGTSFINHSPTPNAAIRWTTHQSTQFHRREWLNMTVEELGDNLDVGLMIEYVALRDIQPGEEIFINYGPAWEQAWNEHVSSWAPVPGSESYVSAEDMNKQYPPIVRTVDEQATIPYPKSVVTSCYYEYIASEEGVQDMSGKYADPSDHDVIVKEWFVLQPNVPDYMFLRPCLILSRDDVSPSEADGDWGVDHDYTVHILNYDHMHVDQKVPDYEFLVVTHVPRDAITFTDFIYSTDMHLRNAFRHEIMMDDALFPRAWRNL